jgi:hypothetical protein
VAGRNQRDLRRISIDIFFEFHNQIVFLDGQLRILYLDQSMFMFVFYFTFAAQIEMIAEDALVPDPDDAELVFAAGTDDFVEQEFPI